MWYSYIAPVEFFIKIFKCFVIRKFLRGKFDIVRKFNFDRCRTVYTNLKPAVISPLYGNKADLPAEMVVCLPHMYLPESKMCKPPVSVVVLKYITVTCCLFHARGICFLKVSFPSQCQSGTSGYNLCRLCHFRCL